MEFTSKLSVEVVGTDEAGLQQASHERAGAGEGVEHVDAFVGETGAIEVFGERRLGRPDVIDHTVRVRAT